jgi:hypothetical protein
MEIPIQKISWENLIKHVRSPLGFLLAALLLFSLVLIIILLTSLPIGVKCVAIGVFAPTLIGVIIWVIKRTPNTPHGLVATEDYYALEKYLEYARIYGSQSQTETKKEMLKKKKITKDMVLPSTNQLELPNGETQ